MNVYFNSLNEIDTNYLDKIDTYFELKPLQVPSGL